MRTPACVSRSAKACPGVPVENHTKMSHRNLLAVNRIGGRGLGFFQRKMRRDLVSRKN